MRSQGLGTEHAAMQRDATQHREHCQSAGSNGRWKHRGQEPDATKNITAAAA